jgi:membrane protein
MGEVKAVNLGEDLLEPEQAKETKDRDDAARKFGIREVPSYLLASAKAWNRHDPWRLGAVVAYYAILSLPGLLVIVINSVGAIWGNEIVEGEINDQIAAWVGEDAAKYIATILESIQLSGQSFWATVIGIGVLLFGATGVFYHLQLSLNSMWDIRQDPKSNILKLLIDRTISFGFVLVIGFLLLMSFVVTALLTALSSYLESIWEPAYVLTAQILDFAISTGVIGLLFALMFRFLPDARVQWSTIWRASLATALLFNAGVFLLGFYFSKASPGTMYGAAGSVVVLLLWVSYACLIFFFGAAMIRVYAERYGDGIKPLPHAVRIREQEVVVEKGSDSPQPPKK